MLNRQSAPDHPKMSRSVESAGCSSSALTLNVLFKLRVPVKCGRSNGQTDERESVASRVEESALSEVRDCNQSEQVSQYPVW